MPTPRKPAPPRRATAVRGRPRRKPHPLAALAALRPVPPASDSPPFEPMPSPAQSRRLH